MLFNSLTVQKILYRRRLQKWKITNSKCSLKSLIGFPYRLGGSIRFGYCAIPCFGGLCEERLPCFMEIYTYLRPLSDFGFSLERDATLLPEYQVTCFGESSGICKRVSNEN